MNRLEQAENKKRQLDREISAVTHSMSIAQERLDKSIEKGQVNALPYKGAALKKMTKVIDGVIDNIVDKSKYNKSSLSTTYSVELIKELKKYLDISTLVSDFLLAELSKEPKTITVMGSQLGRRILRAYQMSVHIKENKYYYEEMTRFLNDNRIGSFDEVYKRFCAGAQVDVDSLKFNKSVVEQFGSALLHKIVEADDTFLESYVDFITPRKKHVYVTFSLEMFNMMSSIIEHAQDNAHDRIPCIIPPQDWVKVGDRYQGGFYSQYLKDATTIQIGDRNRKIPEIPQPYLDALNKLQHTEYGVNEYVYNFVKKVFVNNIEIADLPRSEKIELIDIPSDCNEEVEKELRSERRKQHVDNVKTFSRGIGLYTALKQCEELKNDSIHFVHSLDYRGRLYCMSNGLTTQGADYIKGLIHFKQPKEVGERGLYWLKVRAANCMGYDKAHYDDRVAKIDGMIQDGTVEKIVQDPIGNWDLWSFANEEKPVQFLATLHELATAYRLPDPTRHLSRLAVGLDGACNGSQHLAVLSRDPELARSVNVLPTQVFQDIYQNVVDYVYEHMFTPFTYQMLVSKHTPENIKTTLNWLFTKFSKPPRKLVKRSVMTVPYGSTVRGRMDFTREFINKQIKGDLKTEEHVIVKNKMVAITATLVEKALQEKTGGAIQTMEYIQDLARHEVKTTGTFKYVTPLGLEVDNFIPTMKTRRVRFMNYLIRIFERTDKPNIRKIVFCSAPNYVHSLDACHLTMTINRPEYIQLLAVHDDIGTYPSDTQALYDAVREEFANLYRDQDFLNQLSTTYRSFEHLGTLDVDEVKKSLFFFG